MPAQRHSSTDHAPSFEAALLAADLGAGNEIDLHGMNVNVAMSDLDSFLHHELLIGADVVRIIHGRGGDKLRIATQNLLRSFQKRGLVAAYRDSQHPAHHGAVTVVVLHRIS